MTILSASDVTVRRGGKTILESVSLNAQGGEFVAIIGANGAGKSTLLSALAGLSPLEAGHVSIDAVNLMDIPRRQFASICAYLPQNPRCEWPIAVERLIALGLTPVLPSFGDLAPQLRARVDETLFAVDLFDRRMQACTTLSGGELARAMLGRVLVGDPEIVIVDEPVTGLDPKHALDAMRHLQRQAEAGKLVLVSMHDLTLAARYASRVVALKDGRLRADGPTATTLTGQLLQDLFDVEAHVSGAGAGTYIDFLARPVGG